MRRLPMRVGVVLLGGALLVVGYLAGRAQSPAAPAPVASIATGAAPKTVLYWYDTMVPEQHFPKPGLSPMGMKMVPKYAGTGAPRNGVRIDPGTVQNLGVRMAVVARRALAQTVRVPGTITWDLRKTAVVSARVDAVISKLYVRAPYTAVAAGEPLADVLAPQWSSALAEYGALQDAQSGEAKALRDASRERLQVLGLTPANIQAVHGGSRMGIVLRAPQAGVVTTLEVREGQRVSAGQTLMTVNGLSTVWIDAALPPSAAATIRPGTPVTVTVDALVGRAFPGTVETLLPEVDAITRTQRARIVLNNADGALSPGMFATVQLTPAPGNAVAVVPDDALISTGNDTRVILSQGDGHFRAVSVRLGASADGYTEVRQGLGGGETIVISGQFLIDSEAGLAGALERLNSAGAAPATASSAPMAGMPMDHRR